MRSITKPIGLAACLGLLAVQFSGLHMHVDAHGYLGIPKPAHSHTQHVGHADHHHDERDHDDHGHDAAEDFGGARDVSPYDLTAGSAEFLLALLALASCFVFLHRFGMRIRTLFAYPVLSGRHTRWRPPLRAPPQSA